RLGVDDDVVLRPWSYLVPVSTLTVYPLPVMPDLWDLAAPTAATLTAAALGVAALAALGVSRLRGTARAWQAAGAAVLAACLLLVALGARGESQVYASQVAA